MRSSARRQTASCGRIDRYELTGGGVEAVEGVFAPPAGTSTTIGVAGFLLLMVAVLCFTRAVQRLVEQVWELEPLSVRNTFNELVWIGGSAYESASAGCSTPRSAADASSSAPRSSPHR